MSFNCTCVLQYNHILLSIQLIIKLARDGAKINNKKRIRGSCARILVLLSLLISR